MVSAASTWQATWQAIAVIVIAVVVVIGFLFDRRGPRA